MAVGVDVLVGRWVVVEVGFPVWSKRLVLEGPMRVLVGDGVNVCEAVVVGVRDWVMVNVGLIVGEELAVTVGEFVAVKKSLANSARVISISALVVGVDKLPPVFGMRGSEA